MNLLIHFYYPVITRAEFDKNAGITLIFLGLVSQDGFFTRDVAHVASEFCFFV